MTLAVHKEKSMDKKMTIEDEDNKTDSIVLGESVVETEFNVLDEQEQDNGKRLEKISTEEVEGKKGVKIDYLEIQNQMILSDNERKVMWDNYQHYVDETIFIELRDTTLCRYITLL